MLLPRTEICDDALGLDALWDASPVPLLGLNSVCLIQACSASAAHMLGQDRHALLGQPLPFSEAEQVAAFADLCAQVGADGQTRSCSANLRLADKELPQQVTLVVSRVGTSAQGPGFCVALQDKFRTAPARALLEQFPGAAASVGPDLRYRAVNARYAAYFKRRPDELTGLTVPEVIGPDVYQRVETFLFRALQGERSRYTNRVIAPEGNSPLLDVTLVPNPDDGGFFILVSDGSEAELAAASLQSNTLRWQSVVECNPDIIMLLHRDSTILYLNRVEPGRVPAEFLGRRSIDFVAPERHAPILAAYAKAWDEQETVELEVVADSESGPTYYMCRLAPIVRDGQTECLVAVVRDNTASRRAEETLRQSESRFRAVFEQTFRFLILLGPDGVILDSNSPHLDFLRSHKEQVVGIPLWDAPLWRDADARGVLRQLVATAAQGEPARAEVELPGPRELEFTFDLTVTPVRNVDDRVAFLLVEAFDISQRKEAERALQEREQMLRSLGDNLPSGMVYQLLHDADGRRSVHYISAGVTRLTGLTPQQVRADALVLFEQIVPEDRPRLVQALEHSARALMPFDLEVRRRLATGELRWSYLRSAPRWLPDGRLLWDSIELDITAQKEAQAERVAFQRRLQEGQRLESLGVMATGIAHDFNNLLAGILGNANVAEQESAAGLPVQPYLERIEKATLRAAELCKQMLTFAGKERVVLRPTSLTSLVDDLRPLVHFAAGPASVHYDLLPTVPTVPADEDQLRRALLNLVRNAAEALEGGSGSIMLRTGVRDVNAAFLRQHDLDRETATGRHVFVSVGDTGCGMSDTIRQRVFEPFFTTKFTGRGLGLAAVQGIVRCHHGLITVESQPGLGSCFTILLPCRQHDPGSSVAGRSPISRA